MLIQNSPVGIPEKGEQAAAIGYARLATQHGLRFAHRGTRRRRHLPSA
jgi:hypothetical protein